MVLCATRMLGTHDELVKNHGWYERRGPEDIENQDVQ